MTSLKGNGALEGHVLRIGHFGLKKFLDPDLVYKISVICILARVKTLQKLIEKSGNSPVELSYCVLFLLVWRGFRALNKNSRTHGIGKLLYR